MKQIIARISQIIYKHGGVVVLGLGVCLVLGLTACAKGAGPATIDYGGNSDGGAADKLSAVTLNKADVPEGLASAVYEIELSDAIAQPVTVRIPLTANPPSAQEDTQLLLGIGMDVTYDDGHTVTSYQFLPAERQGENGVATFIPADYVGDLQVFGASQQGRTSAMASKQRSKLGLFWCTTWFEDGGHFMVYFPAQIGSMFINHSDRQVLLDDLEAVYRQYLDLGYGYTGRTGADWPMSVYVKNMSDAGGYVCKWYQGGIKDGWIEINKQYFTGGYQAAEVRPLLAHEFFHFVQMNYTAGSGEYTWVDEATATFFEGKARGRVPVIVSEYKELVFDGVFPTVNNAGNGYSRMPLIAFHAGRSGDGCVRDIYEAAATGASADMVLTNAFGPPSDWAGDFYRALVNGELNDYTPYALYNSLSAGQLTGIGEVLPLKVPSTQKREETLEAGDPVVLGQASVTIGSYGARLLALTIDDTSVTIMPEGMVPVVRVNGGADVSVFAIKGRQTSVIRDTGGGIALEDYPVKIKDQTVYLVLVTAMHISGRQEYEVTVEMQQPPTLDELVGRYEDGQVTYQTVFISDAVKTALIEAQEAAQASADQAEDENPGLVISSCDLDILGNLEALAGQTLERVLIITKTGENTGTLSMVEKGESSDSDGQSIAFTYDNGFLVFFKEEREATHAQGVADTEDELINGEQITRVSGRIAAAYGKNKTVTLQGVLRMDIIIKPIDPDELSIDEGDFYIDILIVGSKPLETR